MDGEFLVSRQVTRKSVLITGFLPFEAYKPNESWEGVLVMNKETIEKKYNIILTIHNIPVKYDAVDQIVPKLWDTCKPDLTIHVGIRDEISNFWLETKACKDGYDYPDTDGVCPEGNRHWFDGPQTVDTILDVDFLCEEFNFDPLADGLTAMKSENAGKYVCEYAYYTSLNYGSSKTLFVHIPIDQYPNEIIAQGLERILESCLRQLTKE